jgi:excisionase family DNA binding protein
MMPDPVERPTLTVDEVAEVLGISRSTAYDAVKTGQIPSIRINARWLIPTAQLRSFLGADPEPARP